MKDLPFVERVARYWGVFSEYVGSRLWVYILLSLLATLTESLGIGLFFPLLSGLQPTGAAPTGLELKFAAALAAVGLPYNLQSVLLSIVVVFLVKGLLVFLAGAYQSRIMTEYQAVLTKRIYGAISGQEYKQFLTRNLGVLSNATVNETNRAMVAFMKYASLFPPLISIAIFTLLAFRLDWRLTAAAVVFGLLVLWLTRYIARLARRFSYQNTEAFGQLTSLVLQSFGAFKYLRSTASQKPLQGQVERTIDHLAETQFYLSATSNLTQSINEPVVMLFLVGMVWEQTVLEKAALSGVVVLALFFFRLMKEVMNFQGAWHGFSATMGSIDIVRDVVSESEGARERLAGTAYPGIRSALRFEDVSFSYGEREVLHGLNLEIPRNAMVAVVGESGSGKSTFVDLLTGVQRPARGRVMLGELPYTNLDLSSLRARLGYVTQEPAIFNDTIANNISFWDQGDPAEVRQRIFEAAEGANCRSFVEKLERGFETELGDRGVNLSGGQRQRVAIARELYKKPDLLILDEATSALDSETEVEIQKSIEALRGRLTVVVIAHRLSTIRNADLIYVFSEGKVVEQGNFGTLFGRAGSHFRKFCDLQGLR